MLISFCVEKFVNDSPQKIVYLIKLLSNEISYYAIKCLLIASTHSLINIPYNYSDLFFCTLNKCCSHQAIDTTMPSCVAKIS